MKSEDGCMDCMAGRGGALIWTQDWNRPSIQTHYRDQCPSPPSYAGLINAGMTCYMNSLLQILYMTPEFRRKIYSLRTCTAHDLSIPYQLQLLFARMQLQPTKSADTEGLWRSFQWDWEQVTLQQDAIEFCQALFEALEDSITDDNEKRLISDVFKGVMVGYVRCEGCAHTSSHHEPFMDISLPVHTGDVDTALRLYFTPEALIGDNQVFCDTCQQRQDAFKGCLLHSLPPILMIQLKRFDMDALGQRRKLHNCVRYPEILNMNPYFHLQIHDPASNRDYLTDCPVDIEAKTCHFTLTTGSDTLSDRDSLPLDTDTSQISKQHLDFECLTRISRLNTLFTSYSRSGSEVYELYAVLTHFGSAAAGHYLAYIKVLTSGKWMQFDDERVQEVREMEVFRTFGGVESGHPCAYLLLYRRISEENREVEVPLWLVEAVEREKKATVMADFRVFSGKSNQETKIQIPISGFLSDLKKEVQKSLEIEGKTCRFWTYIPELDLKMVNLELYEHMRLEYLLHNVRFSDTLSLETLEITGNLPIELRFITSYGNLHDSESYFLSLSSVSTINDLITHIYTVLKLPPETRIHLYRKSPLPTLYDRVNLAANEHKFKPLSAFFILPMSILYCEEAVSAYKRPRLLDLMNTEANKRLILYKGQNYPSGALIVHLNDFLQDVKSRIAEEIRENESEFYLRKHTLDGEELRDLTVTVEYCNLNTGAELWLVQGRPASLETCRIALELASPCSGEEDTPWFSYGFICELIMSQTDTIADLRLKAIEALYQHTGQLVPLEHLSLREKYGDRPGKSLSDRLRLRSISGYRRLSIHILHQDYYTAGLKSVIPISVRLFSAEHYTLSAPIDLSFPRETIAGEVGTVLAKLMNCGEVEVCRVTFPQGFHRVDLHTEQWKKIQGRTEPISGYPLYFGEKGGFLVVKNASQTLNPPPEDVLERYKRPIGEESPTHSEQNVKIHVKRL